MIHLQRFRWWWYLCGLALLVCAIQLEALAQELEESTTSLEKEVINDSNENSILDLEDDEEDERTNSRHFSNKDHPIDHGVYSGRSLASIKNIKVTVSETHEDSNDEPDNHHKKTKHKSLEDEDEESPLHTVDYVEKEWQLMFRAFDLAFDSISGSMVQEISKKTNLFDDIVSRLPLACRRDIYHIKESVKKHRLWALRMLDSNGKIPSGVTYGRFSSPGDYEECLRVSVDEQVYRGQTKNNTSLMEEHKFHGKYCLIDFRLPLPEKPRNKLLSIHESVLNFTGTELERQYPDFIKNYSAYASVFYDIGYMHAFCLPSTCKVEDLTKSMGKTLEGMYIIVNSTVDCEEWPSEGEPLRTSQVISLFLMGFVFINALLSSIMYYLLPKGSQSNNNQDKTVGDKHRGKGDEDEARVDGGGGKMRWLTGLAVKNKFYADCFSVQKNFERLSKPDPRGLTFVHYTRIVAMALTVITHTGALGTLQAITKPADAANSEQIFRDFIPQMLANAFTSIQIFFFMAGFMLVISTYPSIRRDKGQMSFLEYAIKRAIRLMPGIAATICLNFLWPLVVEGPMLKFFIEKIVVPCEINWWHTLGFMSNFDHVEKMCLRHSYFSASDYQLHIVAFPLLLLLYKQPALSLFLASLLTVSGFVAQVIMILTKNVLPFMMVDYIDKEAFFNVVHYIHHPVWNHMSAFFYGFIIGYFVVKQVRVNLSETTVKRIWYTLLPIGILSIFAPYYWNHYKRPILRWQMVLYVIFDRFILLSTCAWLSYASLVLARPPPSKKSKPQLHGPSTDEQQQQQQQPTPAITTVPVIVQAPPSPQNSEKSKGLYSTKNLSSGRELDEIPLNDRRLERNDTTERVHQFSSSMSLRPNLPGSSLPRQRSSPNLINELQQQLQQQGLHSSGTIAGDTSNSSTLRRMHRTTSSSNLATINEFGTGSASAKKQEDESAKGEILLSSNKALAQVNLTGPAVGPSKPVVAGQKAPPQKSRPNQAPVSNVNTLCLILSRLTFQLYLFNMVVLWVDVNNSKYYWYFSYYFIVVKAAAVYIASAVMAMIFFVVLESPCLTLYIAWVRQRAASHARTGASIAPLALVESKSSGGGAQKQPKN